MITIVLLVLALWVPLWRTNITFKNAYWHGHDNTPRIFDHHQTKKSKVIQYCNCDEIPQLQGFNNRCINNHNKEREIKYGTRAGVSSTHTKTNSSDNNILIIPIAAIKSLATVTRVLWLLIMIMWLNWTWMTCHIIRATKQSRK